MTKQCRIRDRIRFRTCRLKHCKGAYHYLSEERWNLSTSSAIASCELRLTELRGEIELKRLQADQEKQHAETIAVENQTLGVAQETLTVGRKTLSVACWTLLAAVVVPARYSS